MHKFESLKQQFSVLCKAIARGSEALNGKQRSKTSRLEQELSLLLTYRPTPPPDYLLIQNTKLGTSFIVVPVLSRIQAWNQGFVVLVIIYTTTCLVFIFAILMRGCRQVNADLSDQQTSDEGGSMTIFFEECLSKDFISGKLEGQLDEIKEQLENIARHESIASILAEDFYKVGELFQKNGFTRENANALEGVLSRSSSSISSFTTRHRKTLSKESYEELRAKAHIFKVLSKMCRVMSLDLPILKTKDTLKNLKIWHETINTYAEFLDEGNLNDLPFGVRANLQELSALIIAVTSKPYIDNSKKEKCRRALRNSAMFILQWLQDYNEKAEAKSFTLGSVPRTKLLEETKSRLHLLDVLSPSNDEEAKEQRETREHLKQALGN